MTSVADTGDTGDACVAFRGVPIVSLHDAAAAQTHEAFCGCAGTTLFPRIVDCNCGESDRRACWQWDRRNRACYTTVSSDGRTIRFTPILGNSASVARGSEVLMLGQHFWEVKLVGITYGDIAIGLGCSEIRLRTPDVFSVFFSMVGTTCSTWGLTQSGAVCHAGEERPVRRRFGQGSIVGVHLDAVSCRATFFLNRRKLCSTRVHGTGFYPMVSARCAKCAVRIVRALSVEGLSLEYACCAKLRELRPNAEDIFAGLPLPARLKEQLSSRFCWITSMR